MKWLVSSTAAALRRRAVEGGNCVVRASLCQTATWVSEMGARCDARAAAGVLDENGESAAVIISETGFGALRHMGPVALLSETPARWDRPAMPLGTHAPTWT